MIDIATLTGAAGVALGQDTGALFASSDALAQAVEAASRRAGEGSSIGGLAIAVASTSDCYCA